MKHIPAFLIALGLLLPAAARADWRDRGDIREFHHHHHEIWERGRWLNGFHDGRMGWWWVVEGIWYYYPAGPVYPYPDPYTPPVVIQQPPVVVQPPPVQQAPLPAQPQVWYYCSNPAGYYPYVSQCSTAWQTVPATPSGPPQ